MAEDETGILIEARNGPVIGYDATGLRLRLSDSVMADIAARLGPGAAPEPVSPAVLGDIDAWSVTRVGDRYEFDAKLPAYPFPRRFCRHVAGGGIYAAPPGHLTAILGLGHPRAASHREVPLAHPAHIVAPDDDIGAVGMGGVGEAPATDRLHPVRAVTLEAATADALIGLREAAGKALPLILARTETNSAPTIAELASGPAMANLARAVENTVAAAGAHGVTPRIPVVFLDLAAGDVTSDARSYIDGVYRVMDAVTAIFARHRLHRPTFAMEACETGIRVAEHWHLSLFPAGYALTITAPGRAFARDRFGRLTADGMARLAATRAHMLDALIDGGIWTPPRLLLAERTAPDTIRVICDGEPLVLGAGDHGFRLTSPDGPVEIAGIAVAADDPLALDLTVPGLPPHATLAYGTESPGALHDGWSAPGPDGAPLHRAALPALLEVR